jgi:hypothetical protein
LCFATATKEFVTRSPATGKSNREIRRNLKCHVCRAIFRQHFGGSFRAKRAAARRRISFSCSGSRTQTPTSNSPFTAVHVVVKRSKPEAEAVDLNMFGTRGS